MVSQRTGTLLDDMTIEEVEACARPAGRTSGRPLRCGPRSSHTISTPGARRGVTTGANRASGVVRTPARQRCFRSSSFLASAKSSIAQLSDGAIQIRVAAPPVEGAANAALLRFLADILDVPRSRLEITSGASTRRKRVVIACLAQTSWNYVFKLH